MSEENVEIVRRAIDAYNAYMRGELSRETAAKFVDPQFEFQWHEGREMPDSPHQVRGVPALVELWEQWRSAMADMIWEPLEFVEASNDRVLVPIRQTGRGRESGVPLESHFFQVWTIRDGNVHKMEFFRHHADALEAAGLRE